MIVAEKPSVARDLARVLGVRPQGEHAFEGDGCAITWCIGHLVELDEPASYDAALEARGGSTRCRCCRSRSSSRPTQARRRRTCARSRACCRSAGSPRSSTRATPGREGELIFRYVYQFAGARLPVRRLWISSLTDEAIRRGFASLRPPLRRCARRRGAVALGGGLARRHERHACDHRRAAGRRAVLDRPRADADARDDRRARARDLGVRAEPTTGRSAGDFEVAVVRCGLAARQGVPRSASRWRRAIVARDRGVGRVRRVASWRGSCASRRRCCSI